MTVDEIRRAYAEEVRAVAHLGSDAVVEAFARVPRERFLGDGPWQIVRPLDRQQPYRTTADGDVRHLYHDVGVALDPARLLNNGQPSALARWLEAAAIAPGDRALHVGCGVGYYTAIIAELVGPTGHVTGYEIDASLAARAREHLAPWPQASVETGDGTCPTGSFDVIFVNAGATSGAAWVGALRAGGRLVVPLTMHLPNIPSGIGVFLRVERADGDRWPARPISQVGIFDCANARAAEEEAELMTMARPGTAERITAVAVGVHERGPACVAHLPGFCLQS
jgi:protein-L-isoaspartate(D-aspartate) O-methyltransferase